MARMVFWNENSFLIPTHPRRLTSKPSSATSVKRCVSSVFELTRVCHRDLQNVSYLIRRGGKQSARRNVKMIYVYGLDSVLYVPALGLCHALCLKIYPRN